MSAPPAPTFGRRNSGTSIDQPSTWERNPSASARLHPLETATVPERLRVPNSVNAGVLAGVVVGALSLAIDLRSGGSAGTLMPSFTLGGRPLDMTPVIVLAALWSGARAAFSAAFMVHAVLRRVGRTTFVSYGLGGAVVAGLYAALIHGLGLGAHDQGLLLEVGKGLAAGLLYRLFAGAAPAA